MGANSPASVVCLLRGCIVAHRQAQQHQSLSVATTARKAILALGNLSAREASRIRTILRHDEDTLLDVQLELAASIAKTKDDLPLRLPPVASP